LILVPFCDVSEGEGREVDGLEVLHHVVAEAELVGGVLAGDDGNVVEIDLFEGDMVEVVALGEDASDEPADGAVLVEQVDIIEHDDKFFSVDSREVLLFVGIDSNFSLSIQKL
jgi:hypothetical protein